MIPAMAFTLLLASLYVYTLQKTKEGEESQAEIIDEQAEELAELTARLSELIDEHAQLSEELNAINQHLASLLNAKANNTKDQREAN